MDNDAETLHTEYDTELAALPDKHDEEYALRIGPMYAEFSDVQWADHVLLLQPKNPGGYVSVRHHAGDSDISEALYHRLVAISDGEL